MPRSIDTPTPDPQPTACRYSHTWCEGGPSEHAVCSSPILAVNVAGYDGPRPILDAQIIDLGDGDSVQLSFSGNSSYGCTVTADQLRRVCADVRAHLLRLEQLANQYEALTAPAVTR